MQPCHECAGHIDDNDKMRTRLVRMLDERIDMLDDALHALRDGRTHITDEFLVRTLDAMRAESITLRTIHN